MSGKLGGLIGAVLGLSLYSASAAPVTLDADAQADLAVTVYQGGTGIIRDRRDAVLNRGENRVLLKGLGTQVIGDSVSVTFPDDSGMRTRGLSVSPARLQTSAVLQRLVGRTLIWVGPDGSGETVARKGRLLSLKAGPVLQFGAQVEVNPTGFPRLPADMLPNDLLADAVVTVQSDGQAKALADIWYMTDGLGWSASYTAWLSRDERHLRLSGDVTLTNATGRDLKDATVTVMAGAINRSQPPRPQPKLMRAEAMAADAAGSAPPTPERAHDLWRYDLAGRHSARDGGTVMVPLMKAATVPVSKRYVLENGVQAYPNRRDLGTEQRQHPQLRLTLRNRTEDGLGTPLPAGTMRVYGAGGDDGRAPLLLGEDDMDRTPVGEVVDLTLGEAFDLTAIRRHTDFRRLDRDRPTFESTFEITLKNAKPVGTVVDLVEWMPGDWEILDESVSHVRKDARRAVWSVSVPAASEAVLRYEVRIVN